MKTKTKKSKLKKNKVALRNKETGFYYTRRHSWTDELSHARPWSTMAAAKHFLKTKPHLAKAVDPVWFTVTTTYELGAS